MTVTDSLTHSDKSNNSVGIRISICHIISYFIIRQNVVLDSLFFFFFFDGAWQPKLLSYQLLDPTSIFPSIFAFLRESIIVLTMCYLFLKDHVLLYRHDYEMKHKQFFRNIWKYHFWSNNHLDQNNVLFKLLSKKKNYW